MSQKVLIIGLGSMGKRRIRNLRALRICDIYGYDKDIKTRTAVADEYGIKIINDLKKISEYGFTFAIISTPPEHHLEPVRLCIKNKIPFFTELNLITKDAATIAKEAEKAKVLGIPSNTSYYDSDISRLSAELSGKESGYFVYHLGQNIHDWHPWQKPGEHFIFHQATNGLRELLRAELPWIIDFFGEIKSLSATNKSLFTGSFGVKDFVCLQIAFKKNIQGIIIFDLISPVVIKKFTMVDDKGTIVWDERNNILEKTVSGGKLKKLNLRNKSVRKDYKFHEDAHLFEMKNMVDIFRGKNKLSYTFRDETSLLKLIDKIENFHV